MGGPVEGGSGEGGPGEGGPGDPSTLNFCDVTKNHYNYNDNLIIIIIIITFKIIKIIFRIIIHIIGPQQLDLSDNWPK